MNDVSLPVLGTTPAFAASFVCVQENTVDVRLVYTEHSNPLRDLGTIRMINL
jgi:hypothetical protein